MTRASNNLLLAALLLALSGCGSDDGQAGSSTPATTGPQSFEFTGYLFRVEGATKICDAILESYPPQCGGESYTVTGLDLAEVDGVQEAQGVAWTDDRVTLQGELAADGETLAVSGSPAVPGDLPPPTGAGQPGSAPG
jgi:hypothetical protein